MCLAPTRLARPRYRIRECTRQGRSVVSPGLAQVQYETASRPSTPRWSYRSCTALVHSVGAHRFAEQANSILAERWIITTGWRQALRCSPLGVWVEMNYTTTSDIGIYDAVAAHSETPQRRLSDSVALREHMRVGATMVDGFGGCPECRCTTGRTRRGGIRCEHARHALVV